MQASSQVGVAVMNVDSTDHTADMYAGFTEDQASTVLYFPLAYRNWSDTLTDKVYVQNIGTTDAHVKMTYKTANFNFTPPTLKNQSISTAQVTVRPNASVTFSLRDSLFNPLNVTFGAITIESDVDVVAVASHVTQKASQPNNAQLIYTQYNTSQTDAMKDSTLVFPLVYKDWGPWRTGLTWSILAPLPRRSRSNAQGQQLRQMITALLARTSAQATQPTSSCPQSYPPTRSGMALAQSHLAIRARSCWESTRASITLPGVAVISHIAALA